MKTKPDVTLKNGRTVVHTWDADADHWRADLADGGEMTDDEWHEYAHAISLENARQILKCAGLK